ncbi:glycosyltransferase [Mumia sp. zg.B21]|nr:glycosyltransferase [Mumia sp. zg.B21]
MHRVSVVVPVYQGERYLSTLVGELDAYRETFSTPSGHTTVLHEIVLVFDNGPDDSARVIRELARKYDYVRPVWLSRNFGQHAATLAGISSSGGDWVVTMDEDGQQDPADIGGMLDRALSDDVNLVYGKAVNEAPHGSLRNTASRLAKWFANTVAGTPQAAQFNSFRLMLGEVARSVAAYAGAGVYLDVALTWVAGKASVQPVTLREEAGESGYRARTLASHFWRMVVTGGTRPLRLVSALGVTFATAGIVLALVFVIGRLSGSDIEPGWTSIITVTLICAGAILFSLGVIAEYIGVAVNMAMGKPLYVIVSDRAVGPHGQQTPRS